MFFNIIFVYTIIIIPLSAFGISKDANYIQRGISNIGDNKNDTPKLSLFKRIDNIEVGNLENGLKRLTNNMMHLIGPLRFSFVGFERNTNDYSMHLSGLDLEIKRLSPPNTSLLEKLQFTHHIFREMSQAVFLEKIFRRTEGRDYQIVVNIISVNLSLLSFLDSFGNPAPQLPIWFLRGGQVDGSVSEYREWIVSYKRTFEIWSSSFGRRGVVCPPLKILFDQQVAKANRKFNELSNFLNADVVNGGPLPY